MTKPCVLAVVGCTASGKSELAMKLAKALHGEIICMDSMQVYRRMDIGTAKPTLAEQSQVRHHMLDILEPTEPYAVADYVEATEKLIPQIVERGHVPLLVGGTGLYLKSLMHGMTLGITDSDPALRSQLNALAAAPQGNLRLHAMLGEVDPASAARLHPNDVRRVIRALEVFKLTGVPLSGQKRMEPDRPFRVLPIGLRMPRSRLYERIQRRVDGMLDMGLLSEVQALLDGGVTPQCQSMQAIGYKELIPVVQGRLPLADVRWQLILNTRHYAKRQETWFKGEPALHWTDAEGDSMAQALEAWRDFINTPPAEDQPSNGKGENGL